MVTAVAIVMDDRRARATDGSAGNGVVAGEIADGATDQGTLGARRQFGLGRGRRHQGAGRQQQGCEQDMGLDGGTP